MKTQELFARNLKEMMALKKLDDISVSNLCKYSSLGRKTFYYHFHNIYDLLMEVFLEEKIDDIDKVKNSNDLLNSIFYYYQNNEKFIDAALSSFGKELVLEFFYNNFYNALLRIISFFDNKNSLETYQKKNIARFYAGAYSYSLVYYLISVSHKSIKDLQSKLAFVSDDDILKSIDKMKKEGK